MATPNWTNLPESQSGSFIDGRFFHIRHSARMSDAPSFPKIDYEGVVARVEALRAAKDMSKGAFAASYGLDPSSYSKFLKGEKPLHQDSAYIIAERWGVTMDYLFRGSFDRMDDETRKAIMSHLNGLKA